MARISKRIPPLQRLGRWNGSEFEPVGEGSVTEDRVHVMTHGWGRAIRDVVSEAGGFLLVWDEAATTEEGARFDRWFGPLAQAIVADDPNAAVLAFSWIDESATGQAATRSLKSQLRTTVNGQRLATALRHALAGGEDQELHVIGYSHGAKVATVASALLDRQPKQLTLLDSPDNVVPIVGGALNDLHSYLRLIAPGGIGTGTFIDNYPSHFGVQYGRSTGLGGVLDVTLDPDSHPLERPPTGHAYAWAWYRETAENPDLGVGYAWSPLRPGHTEPETTQLRQSDKEDYGPFVLIPNEDVLPGTVGSRLRVRAERQTEQVRVLSTREKTTARELFWRRSGDLWASTPVEWKYGPDDAVLVITANRTERARSVRGWSPEPQRHISVPLGGSRFGPMLVTAELESSEPAEVEVRSAKAVNGLVLPTGSEMQAWVRPLVLLFAMVGLLVVARGMAYVVGKMLSR